MATLSSSIKSLLSSVPNVFRGSMADTPNNAVCFYATGGYPADLSGSMIEEPTFLIKVRNTNYDTGEALCNTIIGLLHGSSNENNLCIYSQSGIMDLGKDLSGRSEFTINFRTYYKK